MIEYSALRRTHTILALVLVVLLWSASAQAAQGPRSNTATTFAPQAEFSLVTGDGYSVSVGGSGHTVGLTVERGSALTSYVTRGRSSPDGIRARFGRFGRISVRFKPSGRVRRDEPPKRCKGNAAIARTGVFVGTIRFRGEDGYIDIDASRASGSSSTTPRWRCKRRSRIARISALRNRPSVDTAELRASTPNERVVFDALAVRDPSGPDLTGFFAAATDRRGSVRIARLALVLSDRAHTFVFDDGLGSATVDPPKPFDGTATFQRNEAGPPTWSGSLSVSLLGAPNLPLTGPTFTARLFRPAL